MADSLPKTEIPKSPQIIIGETKLYLVEPVTIGDQQIQSITIQSADKRSIAGAGSSVLLTREASRKKGNEGVMVDKPMMNLNEFDEVVWDKISGIEYRDEAGTAHTIAKENLSLNPPENVGDLGDASTLSENPQTQEVSQPPAETPRIPSPAEVAALAETPLEAPQARTVLENLKEDPNTITIVGLKAYEARALDLAERSMQHLVTPKMIEREGAARSVWEKSKDKVARVHDFITNTMWKQSMGGIYFKEKARQYYMDMLTAAETPFAEQSIRVAEARAQVSYDKMLADKNFLARAGTKAREWWKDVRGARTTVQKLALMEIATMKENGELRGMDIFEREAKSVRLRFGQDMNHADQFVRKALGEHLEILDPEIEEHKPLVEGIGSLMKRYATGEIADKAAFDREAQTFFKTTLKDAKPGIFAEAELYSSSLFDAAETLRAKASHEGGLANIDADLANMKIRLGLGQMGEATSLEPDKVANGIEKVMNVVKWVESKNFPLSPLFFNEATIGGGVAFALSAFTVARTIPVRMAAGLGAGAIAGGTFAGMRQYHRLQNEYLTHVREREVGTTFGEHLQKRKWFEKYLVKQRSADDLMATLQSNLYTPEGVLKDNLSIDELRSSFATLADIQARKTLSETGLSKSPRDTHTRRIGLIQFTGRENIESQRTALDIVANRALSDLNHLSDLGTLPEELLGGNTFPDFMVKLTTEQTRVLKEGVNIMGSLEDPVKNILGLVSSYAPEAEIVRRRFPLGSNIATAEEKALGIDAIFAEFQKEAKVEAIKYGIKQGVIGAGVGAVFHGAFQLIDGGADDTISNATEAARDILKNQTEASTFAPDVSAAPVETITLHPSTNVWHSTLGDYQIPEELEIITHTTGSPDDRVTTFSAILHASGPLGRDISLGDNLSAQDLIDKLDSIDGIEITDPKEIAKKAIADMRTPVETPPIQPTLDEAVPPPKTAEFTIQGKDLGDGGLWEYFRGQASGENVNATTNGMKNLFRLYTHNLDNANIDLAEGSLPLRDATYGTMPVSELDISHIPSDATITLPEQIFGAGGIEEFQNIQTQALLDYQQMLAQPDVIGPGDAIQHMYESGDENLKIEAIVLKLGYAGQDSLLPNPADLELLYEKMGATIESETMPPPTPIIEAPVEATIEPAESIAPETTTKIPGAIFASKPIEVPYLTPSKMDTAQELAAQMQMTPDDIYHASERASTAPSEKLFDTLPWFPIFIPNRRGLESARSENPASPESIDLSATMLSPYGVDANLITREQLSQRVSPRLSENAAAALDPQEEIRWYLDNLSSEEKARIVALRAQETRPMSPTTRAAVIIPVSNNAQSLQQTLASYTAQTDKDGNPLDPTSYELVVYNALVGDSATDQLQATIDQFKADHPDTQMAYVTHTYADIPTPGQLKRDMSNVVLQRVADRVPAQSTVASETPAPEGQTTASTVETPVAESTPLPDVSLINDTGFISELPPTYVSSMMEGLSSDHEMLVGQFAYPKEAYEKLPMVFAPYRAYELVDSLTRHTHADGLPNIVSGNNGVRASTLAAVGGYNGGSQSAEDREVAWMIQKTRGANTSIGTSTETLTFDTKALLYAKLQQAGVADATGDLSTNETYNAMSWQDMGEKVKSVYTRDMLQNDLTDIYNRLYPALHAKDPESFDKNFHFALDSMGLAHDIADGKITILDDTKLASAITGIPDIESFSQITAEKFVEQEKSAREVLANMAGEQPKSNQEEVTDMKETRSSNISSPELDLDVVKDVSPTKTLASHIASPDVGDLGNLSNLGSLKETSPAAEALPEGINDRIDYVLDKHQAEKSAKVSLTPGELMHYLQTDLDIAGTRVTSGEMTYSDGKLHMKNLKAKNYGGEYQFSADLLNDPQKGLIVDPASLQMKLPFIMKMFAGTARNLALNLSDTMLTHINGRSNPMWNASRIDLVGEKLEIKFDKKV